MDWLFRAFNRVFEGGRANYVRVLGRVLRHCGVTLVLYAGLLALTWFGFHKVPTGFIPSQDKGNIFCYLQLPDGASLQRTEAVSQRVVQLLTNTPGIAVGVGIRRACRWSPWATAPTPRACSSA